MTENFCSYCNGYHEMLDFGQNLIGERVLVCSNRLSDVIQETRPDEDYGELEDAIIGE